MTTPGSQLGPCSTQLVNGSWENKHSCAEDDHRWRFIITIYSKRESHIIDGSFLPVWRLTVIAVIADNAETRKAIIFFFWSRPYIISDTRLTVCCAVLFVVYYYVYRFWKTRVWNEPHLSCIISYVFLFGFCACSIRCICLCSKLIIICIRFDCMHSKTIIKLQSDCAIRSDWTYEKKQDENIVLFLIYISVFICCTSIFSSITIIIILKSSKIIYNQKK